MPNCTSAHTHGLAGAVPAAETEFVRRSARAAAISDTERRDRTTVDGPPTRQNGCPRQQRSLGRRPVRTRRNARSTGGRGHVIALRECLSWLTSRGGG